MVQFDPREVTRKPRDVGDNHEGGFGRRHGGGA
jgi:hypothetical protein